MTPISLLILVVQMFLYGAVEGQVNRRVEGRILNGRRAVKGQFPYQALLIQDTVKNTTEFCGGALISNKHILTAAHCSHGTYSTKVYLGVVDTNDGSGVVHCIVDSANTFVHPQWNLQTYQNDIAILKLPISAPITDRIQPISLPKAAWAPPATFDNYVVVASGWGQTSDVTDGIQRYLQFTRVNKMSQRQCAQYYYNTLPVTDNMICTDKKAVYSGPCHGDSGGPLTVRLHSGVYLIGAVSWSVGECSSDHPIVYANVAYYLPWIRSVTGLPTF